MSPGTPVRWKLVLEYDGATFAGWQLQPRQRTVQGVLEDALARLFGEAIRVHPSGRTDAGVHATGQVVHFDATTPRTPEQVRAALNALLPDDVAVRSAALAPADFDARRWAVRKRYRYRWLDHPSRSPLRRGVAWHVRGPLDAAAMHEAAQVLLGRHDFTSFRATGCTAAHPIRVVLSATVSRDGDEVRLDVEGHGFLRHMVRIIAGTLTPIGQGRKPPSWMREVRDARDRAAAGRTAPAHGLLLVGVEHADAPFDRAPLDAD